jgi:hypothetical protein
MRVARTTTTTVKHWITVDLTPDEALDLRDAINELTYESKVGLLLALRNNLTTALDGHGGEHV